MIVQGDLQGLSKTGPVSPLASQPDRIVLPIVYPQRNILSVPYMTSLAGLPILATGLVQFVSVVLLDCEGCSAGNKRTPLENHSPYYMSGRAEVTEVCAHFLKSRMDS